MKRSRWQWLLILACASAGPARGQLESPLLSKVQLNAVNPGGKSLAMGGAFVSLADDPTAAYANPAGLSQLGSWQVGVSGKGFRFEPRLDTDNFTETASGFNLSSVDTYRPSGKTQELEFVTLVIPVVQDVTVGVYRAVNLRYKLDASDLVGGNYRAFFVNRQISEGISQDEQGGLDLRNEIYGVSVGAKFGPVSVGGGVTLNKLRYDFTGGNAGGSHLYISNDVNGLRTDVQNPQFTTEVGASVNSNTKLGWVLGFRAVLDEAHAVALGGVYRRSPTFDIDYSIRARLGSPTQPGAVLADFACGRDDVAHNIPGSSACGTFHTPDDFSFGISARPFAKLLLSADIQRIRYSQLNDGYVPIFAYNTTAGRVISNGTSEDGTLPRFGAEFSLVSTSAMELWLRAGYFHEPAHGTKALLFADTNRDRRPDTTTPVDAPPFTQAYAATFDGGRSENHYSFGLGASISRRISIDLAFDIASSTKVGVLSAFARF